MTHHKMIDVSKSWLSLNIDVCETLMPPFPNMTFDLDLWPTDLKINRDHLLIKDYLPTKFEASGTKPSELSVAQG